MKETHSPRLLLNSFISVTLGLVVISCERPGDDIDIPTGPVPTVEYLVEQGWENYESEDYSMAKDNFTQAINKDVFYKEAHLGSGWTLNRLSDFNAAVPKFDLLLALVDASDTELVLLAYAGKALSFMGLNTDSSACLQIEQYLSIADSSYEFSHDNRVSTENMKKLLLNGYWNYQDYYHVQTSIIEQFDSNWLTGLIATDEGITELSDSTGLVSFDFEVDTTTVPFDTTITKAWVSITEDRNLIEITAITDSLSFSYPVKKFNHGKNIIFLDLDVMEDKSMFLDDMTQPVIVDYVNVTDYGSYLNTLLEKVQTLY
ncbi:hypothetical protein KAR91_23230 [Candidatus Pacearchaeota archaeon]|nr:hypothetical protein [Candidatus Pacearchaeota archaeon]